MTSTTHKHFVIILDRSGSMHPIKSATERGLRVFLDEQQMNAPGATVSLYQFDDQVETVYENWPLAEVRSFKLEPRWRTALLDAIGFAITAVRASIANMNKADRPEEVVVVLLTDGKENSSTIYTLDQAKELIAERQSMKNKRNKIKRTIWRFIYLGADPSTFQMARDLGIDPATTLHYGTDHVEETLTTTSHLVTRGRWNEGFTDAERDATRG
jgi:hypothetical protein